MGTPLNLLFVEDNTDDRELAVLALRRGGYDPVWRGVSNAEQLEDALREQSWDIVLCDYALPGFSGVEALRLIRAVHRLDVPVVILSGVIGDETAVDLIKCGAQDYVLKDNLSRLAHTVARAIADVDAARKKKEVDSLLDRERQLLSQLMTSIPAAIYFKDRQLRHTHVNELACHVLGASGPEELLGRTADFKVDPVRAKKMRSEEERIFRTGNPVIDRIERVTQPDGSTRWYSATKAPIRDGNDEIIGLVGITSDVTDRMSEEQKRMEMELWIGEVLRVAPYAIIAMNRDQKIIAFNSSAERTFGYRANEIIGQSVETLLPPQAVANHRVNVAVFERFGESQHSLGEGGSIVGRRKNGEVFPAEAAVSKFTLNGNTTFIAVIRDITARQAMMAENERLEQSLRQAEKMQSLGTLAGGIAHEFNNLLTPIQLLSEMALDDLSLDDNLRKDLQTILGNSQRAEELVERILAFSRPDKPEVKERELRLHEVVDETIGLLRKTLPSSISIRRDFDDFDDRVMADETQLNQVLMNLGSNAAYAMRGEVGKLTFGLRCRGLRRSEGGRGEAVLTVRDTGCGMDEEIVKRIFEPFFTTKPVGEGTGMGLAIIHGIIESHGGRIRVESAPGKGTAFHIYLPLIVRGKAAVPRRAKRTEPIIALSNKN